MLACLLDCTAPRRALAHLCRCVPLQVLIANNTGSASTSDYGAASDYASSGLGGSDYSYAYYDSSSSSGA